VDKNYRVSDYEYEHKMDKLSIIATLIARVTFMVMFAIPSGYFQDGPNQGLAILRKNFTFYVFMIFDTFAFFFSLVTILPNLLQCYYNVKLETTPCCM
jgi:hypothetical protein